MAVMLGHTTVVRFLLHHCEKHGVSFPEKHMAAAKLPMEEAIELLVKCGNGWCDVRNTGLSSLCPHFHWDIRNVDGLYLCQQCMDKDTPCLDPGHQLIKHVVKDGELVAVDEEESVGLPLITMDDAWWIP
jgi:hypothetical protein